MSLTDILLFGEAIIGNGSGGVSVNGALCAVYHSSETYETVEGYPHFSPLEPVSIKSGIAAIKTKGGGGIFAGEMTTETMGSETIVICNDIVIALVVPERLANSDDNVEGFKAGMYVANEDIADMWMVWEPA